MKESETFIINLRANSTLGASGVLDVTINIADARQYKHFKMFVKDFLVVESSQDNGQYNADIFSLCSDTLVLRNSYDNFDSETLDGGSKLLSGSKVLCLVSLKKPYSNSNNESYFNILSLNGNHRFWVEDFETGNVIKTIDFFASLVVVGYN